jgi:hypothetical protein
LSSPATDRRRWIALGLLALTQFMLISDQTVVNIAVPSIGSDLDISGASLSWALNAAPRRPRLECKGTGRAAPAPARVIAALAAPRGMRAYDSEPGDTPLLKGREQVAPLH